MCVVLEGPSRRGKAAYTINTKNTNLPLAPNVVSPSAVQEKVVYSGALNQEGWLTFPASFLSSEGLVS